MPRRFINQLTPQESVREVFVVADKQLRPNRNGNLYLQVELSDRSGAIAARLWNANETVFNSIEDGQYVLAEGTTQIYQGAMQMILKHISPVSPDQVDPDDFIPTADVDLDRLATRLAEMLRGLHDPNLRSLAECFLGDDEFMAKFTRAPAGVKNHHAHHGGLLEHVVSLMELVLRVTEVYHQLDRDLLLMGAFVHDMGKIDELSYERGFAYTDEGQLVGHLVMAVSMLERKIEQVQRLVGEPFPQETVLRLKHMIVSHHGSYEFGSPKLPMTPEAIALHQLDNLDAKIYSFEQQIRDDLNTASAWTQFNPTLGRKLFKGRESAGDAPAEEDVGSWPGPQRRTQLGSF